MANSNMLLHGDKHFDPDAYIDDYYQTFQAENTDPGTKLLKFVFQSFHEIFKKGEIAGDSLLALGSGPLCHNVYAASEWFREITLTDISAANLEILRSWKAGKRQFRDKAFNYMIGLNDKNEDADIANQRLSKQVKNIVQCDFRKSNMLAGTEVETTMFDAIIVCLCQNVAAFNYKDFERNVANFTKYLKPGGHVIAHDVLGCTYYTVGQDTFVTAPLKKEGVVSAYQACGYEIISWTERTDLYDPDYKASGNQYGCFALVGRKP